MDSNIVGALIGLGGAIVGAVTASLITIKAAKQQINALKEATEMQIEEGQKHSDELASENLSVSKASSFMERFSSPSYMEVRDEVEAFLVDLSSLTFEKKLRNAT